MADFPITKTQLGIFLAESSAKDNAAYNIDMLYHLDENIEVNRFKTALEQVIDNHPYVKSRLIQNDEGEIRMEDHSSEAPCVEIREAESIEAIKAELGGRYDILNDRLYRLIIYMVGERAYFYMSFHHIIFDGMSFEAFSNDLNSAYRGENLTPECKDGFAIAVEEEELRNTDIFVAAREWHEKEFGAMCEVDSMPIPDVFEKNDGKWIITDHAVSISEEEVKDFCEKHGVSTSIPFTAAFGYTLANFTANEEIIYATAFHGRTDKATRDAMTMMVKTFPASHDFRKTQSVAELIKQTSTQIKETRKHTIYSLADINKDLGFEPHVSFVYQGALHSFILNIDGRVQKAEDFQPHAPGLDFIVQLIQDDKEYKCRVDYNDGMFSAELIEHFCKSYNKVLHEMMVKDNLADIELVDEEESVQLDGFNETLRYEGEGETVVSLFRKVAAHYPDNIAVIFKDKKITYRELDEMTDRIASRIDAEVVSIIIGRSEKMPICALSALKAGAAYQPLDPSYPQERLNFMVKDSNAQLLIADRDLRPLLNEYEGKVIYTDDLENETLRNENQKSVRPDSAFILLYTSGSTGVPKGVILEHRNLVTFCDFYRNSYNLNPEHRVSAYASFGFDANMMDTYPALTTGAAMVIIPEEIRLDLDAINAYLEQNNVTHAFFTTQVGQQFVSAFPKHKTLQHVSMGGEKMASIDVPLTYKMYNLYGPTEGTVFATLKEVTRKEQNIPIGHSNSTAPCYIVNKHGKRVPVGAAGELVIAGPQVSRGYLNRPDKTAEVFDAVHFGEGVRTYRTGDIVRYREDGDIEFVGRKDGQVKIRGFRIELKEVEAVIREFEDIKDATVQAFDLESGGKYIAAYIVSDKQIDIQALNGFILSQKPPYMVPAVTMQIDAIPLNVNQKVDKKKLPKPEVSNEGEGGNEDCAPRELNVLEQQLSELVTQLISNTPGISTPLAYCGLSSILSMRLAAQLFKKYGIKMTSKELLGGATILTIENNILNKLFDKSSESADNSSVETAPSIQTEKEVQGKEALLSFPQQGVFADSLMHPGTTIYNIPVCMKFPASVDAAQLKEVAEKALETHPILFAHFETNANNQVVQVIPDDIKAEIETITLGNKSMEEVKAEFLCPFDIENDTLWHAAIVSADDATYLLLDIHHLVSDGSSLDIITSQIVDALNGQSIEGESYSYIDFCIEQQQFAQSEQFVEHKTFFADLLQNFETNTDITPDITGGNEGKQAEVTIPIPEGLDTEIISGITGAHFWLAATSYALGRFSNSKDIYITTVSSGRQNLDIAETVGMFVNTLPVAAHIQEQTVADYVRQVADMFRGVIDHENYPFAQIATDYGYTAGITFAYQLGILTDRKVNGEQVISDTFGLDTPKFHIGIFVEMREEMPHVILQYDDSLYSASLMQQLAESIISSAVNMLKDIDAPVKKVSIMNKLALEAICLTGKGEDMDYDQSQTIPDFLRYQAKVQPDAIAVVFQDKALTYKELDIVTDRLAVYLTSKGVGRETVVGCMIIRSELMAIYPMAIMKAGGAYMPLDPEFPEDRLMFMIEDAGVNLILATDGLVQTVIPNFCGEIFEEKQLADLPAEAYCGETTTADSLMVVLYTSGSTGKPKGVLLEQKSIVNFCHWYVKDFHLTNADRSAAYANFGFDAHMMDIYPVYLAGATVHILDNDLRHDLAAMADYFNENKITIAFMTTQICCQMATLFELPSMRLMSAGGEKMPHLTPPPFDFYNGYGPTECSLYSTFYKVVGPFDGKIIGRPLANYQLYVVDADMNILPYGATGELLVMGRCVARGYLNRPDVNAEKFILIDGEKAYRTGDAVRWTQCDEKPLGEYDIEYFGRMDGQVKLRGLRIELGEVDSMMSKFPSIAQAVAVVKEVAGTQHLCGYYTEKEDMTVNEQELRDFMHQSLTDFMVPDFLVCMDVMPLTPNGKIDRRNLPTPEVETETAEYVEPATETERFVCETMAAVLNKDKVGTTDDFFKIGGTSLIAMRLAVAIGKGGYKVVYKDLFENPTPRRLAAFITGEMVEEAVVDEEITNYDYSQLDEILVANNIDSLRQGKMYERMGNVLLTGATGYLGIHVMHELLQRSDVPKIYCLVRHNKHQKSDSRLRTLLFYYFGNSYEELFDDRIIVIDGDVTNSGDFDKIGTDVDVVINCAANVKHFSAGTDIEDINIGGCRNCIDFCLKTDARFIQTSTCSVGGSTVGRGDVKPHFLTENELYYGQDLSNKYCHSKFIAERDVLDAIRNKGLKGKIMRMGNLAARSSDGEFQINFHSNSFMGTLKALQTLGCMPYSMDNGFGEFSPIDESADAIVRLSLTPDELTIFQITNMHNPPFGDIVDCMNEIGISIKRVEIEEFQSTLNKALENPSKADILQSLLAYNSGNNEIRAVINRWYSEHTAQILLRLGFRWSFTTWNYMENFLKAIQGLGFFDDDYKR